MSVQHLNRYLRQARSDILSYSSKKLYRVVTGNEASDADSIVSAIVLAYIRFQLNHESIVPVMSIPRREFGLRCETNALMKRLQIDIDALIFSDEIDLDRLDQSKQLRLILTDHNALCPSRQHLDRAVEEIIDHHQDMGKHTHVTGNQRCIAFDPSTGRALVGSCCTLIAEEAFRRSPSPDPLIATLLLAPISLDTVNFDPAVGKVTSRDISAAARVADASLIPNPDLFRWLQDEKFNLEYWKEFQFQECLKYDYKQFGSFGTSSVLIPVEDVLAKATGPSAEDQLRRYCRDSSIECLFLLSNHRDDDDTWKRQLLIFSPEQPVFDKMQRICESISSLELKKKSTGSNSNLTIVYDQANVKISRKRFVPLLLKALSE